MFAQKINRLAKVAIDPRWWGFYLQRRVMNPERRSKLSNFFAKLKPSSKQANKNPSSLVGSLQEDGIHMLAPPLTPAQCKELHRYFSSKPVHDPYRPKQPHFLPFSKDRHPDAHIAHHDAIDIINAPYLLDIANDPMIHSALETLFGCKPTIGYMAAWWRYHTAKGAQEAELFHRDVDDWRFIKLFIYLTDVGPKDGPHKYVKGSATSKKMLKIGRFTDAAVASRFGEENILTLTAPAGSAFLENTFGIHKGQPVSKGGETRLLAQIVYTLGNLPYAPKKTVMAMESLPENKYDPYINRKYISP